MKKLLFIVSIISTFHAYCQKQDYTKYWEWNYKMDACIIDSSLIKAQIYYDSIFQNYDFIHAENAIKGLSLSVACKDTVKFSPYLKQCFKSGITDKILDCNTYLINNNFNWKDWISNDEINKESAKYTQRIDLELSNYIDSLFEIDQQITRKINNNIYGFMYYFAWRKIVTKHAKLLKLLFKQGKYPSEKRIGIRNYDYLEHDNIYGKNFELGNDKCRLMLIHYFSYYENDFTEYNQLLKNFIITGDLPPEKYAIYLDFQSQLKKTRRKGDKYYYNCWHIDPDTSLSNLNEIEKRRLSLGIYPLKYHKKKWDRLWHIEKNNLHSKYIYINMGL